MILPRGTTISECVYSISDQSVRLCLIFAVIARVVVTDAVTTEVIAVVTATVEAVTLKSVSELR